MAAMRLSAWRQSLCHAAAMASSTLPSKTVCVPMASHYMASPSKMAFSAEHMPQQFESRPLPMNSFSCCACVTSKEERGIKVVCDDVSRNSMSEPATS